MISLYSKHPHGNSLDLNKCIVIKTNVGRDTGNIDI
jgi:hypothetical protein